MARTTKERLAQIAASEMRNRESERAFVDRDVCRLGNGDDRQWMIDHFEARLVELIAKGAHRTHPWITERYESDLNHLYKGYRIN